MTHLLLRGAGPGPRLPSVHGQGTVEDSTNPWHTCHLPLQLPSFIGKGGEGCGAVDVSKAPAQVAGPGF